LKSINLYIDESGNLGTGMGRYFLIVALEIKEENIKSINKRAGRVINRFKIKKGIKKQEEVKGSKLKEEDRLNLLKSILFRGVQVRYIVLDLKYTTMLLKKSEDKNACFNYLVQLLLKKVIEDYPSLKEVNLFLDKRTVKIGNKLSLKPYLYNKLVLEKLEQEKNVKRIEFNITYMESESCYLIEWADIIANAIYKKYHLKNEQYYKKIKPYIIHESKFPSKNFGCWRKKKKMLLLI